MNKARLFENKDVLISAADVENGTISKFQEFITPEEEFKVTYVSKAKNNGKPYFRLYYSYEDYKNFTDEQKTRYDILKNMCHFAETQWHRDWESHFSKYGEIEKYIKNDELKKYKRADVFIENINTCIELQHSYVDNDFTNRNDFYKKLGYKTIWLFDMTKSSVEKVEDYYEILEDNAKGFFKVALDENNLMNNPVYIQAKDKLIYRVGKLYRKEIQSELQSTIRYFYTWEVYTEDQFINAVVSNGINQIPLTKELKQVIDASKELSSKTRTLYQLWDNSYRAMIICNVFYNSGKTPIIVYKSVNGSGVQVDRDGNVIYQYVTIKDNQVYLNSNNRYTLKKSEALKKEWIKIGHLTETLRYNRPNRFHF